MPRRGPMTDEHKEAIRQGRLQSSVVKAYLDTLDTDRRRTSDAATLQKRLEALDARVAKETNRVAVLKLKQQRLDLERALKSATSDDGSAQDLEGEFVKVAADWAQRN